MSRTDLDAPGAEIARRLAQQAATGDRASQPALRVRSIRPRTEERSAAA